MAQASSSLECPVCSEEFGNPKLLSCNHVVCKKCIVDWLQKAGHSGGCPLCRASILPSSCPPSDDVETLVDALPTDLVIVAKVESQQLFNSRDECMSCVNNTAASSFCFQCKMKLCVGCAKSHRRIPFLKSHVIEDLNQLTAERLAAVPRVMCQSHDDRLAEVFCSTHGLLICSLCSSTTHRQCAVQLIQQAAVQKREELRQQAQSLRDKEKHLKTKVKRAKDKFADMRTQTTMIFDDLQQRVETARQRAFSKIQAEEDKMALTQLDKVRAAVTSQAGVLEKLLECATDDALLDMVISQESRLQQLQQQLTSTDSIQDPVDVRVDSHQLTQLKVAIDALGQQGPSPPPPTSSTPPVPPAASVSTTTTPRRSQLSGQQGPSPPPPPPTSSTPPVPPAASVSSTTTPQRTQLGGQQGPAPPPPPPTSSTPPKSSTTSTTTTTKPRGAALARVLKAGDRVTLRPDCVGIFSWYRGRQGTVTAVPSRLMSSRGEDPTGCVDVRWDGEGKDWCYCMGCMGLYHLDLV